jgi:hypothetical protein
VGRTRDNSIVGGAPYREGDVVRSWNLPVDFVTLMPINATAKQRQWQPPPSRRRRLGKSRTDFIRR